MTACIIQCENREKSYYEKAFLHNRSYCMMHGIDYLFYKSGSAKYSPYWWKVELLLANMQKKDDNGNRKYNFICWLDSDALVHNIKYHYINFFDSEDIHFIGGEDVAVTFVKWFIELPSVFQASVFMTRSNDIAETMFTEWLNLFDASKWLNGKYIGSGCWAGPDYEQGSFIYTIMPKYKDYIKIYPFYYFSEDNYKKPNTNCWSIHLTLKCLLTRYKYYINV